MRKQTLTHPPIKNPTNFLMNDQISSIEYISAFNFSLTNPIPIFIFTRCGVSLSKANSLPCHDNMTPNPRLNRRKHFCQSDNKCPLFLRRSPPHRKSPADLCIRVFVCAGSPTFIRISRINGFRALSLSLSHTFAIRGRVTMTYRHAAEPNSSGAGVFTEIRRPGR